MNIDEQLLSQNEEEKAGEFRAARRAETQEKLERDMPSLRENIQQKRSQELKNFKDEELMSGTSGINPILKSTDAALKFAWENLITSFGLTLIWIDIHVFLNKIFGPKAFRTPGEEWIPDEIKKIASKSKSASSLLRIVEGSGIGCLNLGCIFIVIFIFTLISIIASIISGDLTFIWEMLKGAISDIALVFK